ncbi:MAG: hypothetical protein AAF467_22645 [Actinomycetota bacterium]
MERLLRYAVNRYVGGPNRSWLYTSAAVLAYRFVRSTMTRKEIVEIGGVGRGQKIVIEHLPVTHAEQIKEGKRVRKAEKRQLKVDKRQARVEKRARRSERRARRTEKRQVRAARRAEKRSAKAA